MISRKPICVVLVIDDLEYGGAQRQVLELANNMDPTRFDVHVCTLSDYVPLGKQLTDADRRLHVIVKKNKLDISVVPRLAQLLKSLEADIVHSYLFSADIAARLAGRLAGTTLVIGSERNANYVPKKRHVLAYKLTRRCVHLTIANSKTGAEFNTRMFGQPASDCRVVYNGVDTQRFKAQSPNAIRTELGITEEDLVIGVFASFKPQKNHGMLLRAFRQVLDDIPETTLLLVGDRLTGNMGGTADYHVQMEALIDELNIRHKCIFLGNRNDVERLYPACDITALSSLYEGTPNVLLESMASGIPVVATRVSDNAYIIKEGETGCLVQLDDVDGMAGHLRTLLHNAPRRREMGRKAQAWANEKFSIERLIKNTEDVYVQGLHEKRQFSQTKNAKDE
ncbi:MAG: glycosyltransferase [Planctomycetes bacterium]|nr:glycosyltransferase [Planctomycetota bacterium]